jgi:hypothetical protein
LFFLHPSSGVLLSSKHPETERLGGCRNSGLSSSVDK